MVESCHQGKTDLFSITPGGNYLFLHKPRSAFVKAMKANKTRILLLILEIIWYKEKTLERAGDLISNLSFALLLAILDLKFFHQ